MPFPEALVLYDAYVLFTFEKFSFCLDFFLWDTDKVITRKEI